MKQTEHAELRRILRSDFDYDALMQCAWLLSAEYPFLGFNYLGESAVGRGIPLFSLGEGKKENAHRYFSMLVCFQGYAF